jgi:hypothetical protein
LCRNLGDDQGRGKVRVYDVRVQAPRPCALTADVDAAATSIPFTLVDGSPQLRPPMMYGMHLQLGDEQIRITDVNAAGNVFTGCVRGWNGTTAAAHANGESFTARAINSWISVFLTTSSDDPPNTHYTNLAVYEPDGWDAPSPRAKVSLPPHDNRLVNKSRKPYLEPGVGVFRYMTETPTQGSYRQAEHPEHYTRLDDPIWSYPRGQMVYHFSEVKPFDLASTPYAYTSTPWPSTETYTAVLGAPITTTPPSGTVETITITDGRATPVLHGQSLFGGGETMRVVGLPLAGDEYQVERGAENTPTATHAAGPITVGYRVPIASMNQIQHPGSSIIHYYEATLDESLSSPATFGAGLYDRWGGPSSATGVPALNADANVTARRSLTLTAPLTSSSLTLAVAPADPGDWDVIAKKMCVTIGAESLSVTGVDAAAGTVTVASRPSGSQGYPTGTPLTTSAAGLLFRSADGLSQAYNGMFTNAAAMYALGANRVLLSTYNDSGTGLTVGTTVARAQTLDPTKAKTIPYVYPSVNGTFELTVEHTKMAPKCWHWLNVPFRATDAAVYAAAKVVRDNLPPGRKVIFELGNELWNTAFHHTPTANRTSGLCGVGTARDLLILRSKTAFDVVKRCFAEVGREDEVLLSICWQTAYDVLADCRRLGVNPDVAAVAPYLTPGATPLFGTVVNNIDDGQVCDLFAFHMFYMFNPGTLRYTGNVAKASLAAHEAATGKRVIAAAYEGGVEELLGSKNSTYVVNPNFRRTRDVLKHPAFYHTTRDIYAAFREVGGIEVFAEFMVAAYPNKSVTWGMLQAPTQKPGYGDGRNGGVNNLDYSFMNPTDLVHEGGDGITESTRMQGWLDHQQAWMAANELNPDPDPHDPEPTDPGTTPQPPSIHIARPRKFVISRFRSRFG